ncbi:MAG: hypothetical protein GX943_00120 [Candidatus Pacebacteria bacterium]|jgi:hypothetical protein|nr:hypothetical protein [Candidatus Paceibacterota bacterium]
MTSNNSNDEIKRVTLFLNKDILKHAKAKAILEETTLTLLVEKALTQYLPEETVIKKARKARI